MSSGYYLTQPDHPVIAFCIDDSRADVSEVSDLFIQKKHPLCLATIPARLSNVCSNGDTVLQTCKKTVANGGEILSHSAAVIDASSTDADYYEYFINSKAILKQNGFTVRGIVKAGGGADNPDVDKVLSYLKSNYTYGTGFQYISDNRYNIHRNTLAEGVSTIKLSINKISAGGILIYYGHGASDLGENWISDIETVIDYIDKTNAEIVTIGTIVDRYLRYQSDDDEEESDNVSTATLVGLEAIRSELAHDKYYLNIKSGYMAPVTLHCSLGDSGQKITFFVFDGTEKLTLDSASVALHGTRKDGANFGPFNCTVSGNAVTFTLQPSMTAVEGAGIAELSIVKGSSAVGTCNFAILVENATFPNGVSYDTDPSVYEDILKYVQGLDTANKDDYVSRIAAEAALRATADATNATNINVQSKRIDNIISSGTTPEDGELIDIRTKADGTSATTAGNAVREQIDSKQNKLGTYERIDIEKSIGRYDQRTPEEPNTSYVAYTCLKYSVIPGEKYRITCGKQNSANTPAMFYTYNGSYAGIQRDADMLDYDITVPNNVDCIYLNGSSTYHPVLLKFTESAESLIEEVARKNVLVTYDDITFTSVAGNKSYTQDAERTPVITRNEAGRGYYYAEFEVKPKEQYRISCSYIANAAVVLLYDRNKSTIAQYTADSDGNFNSVIVTIPSNAYYMIVNRFGSTITLQKGIYRNIVNETVTNNITEQRIESATLVNNQIVNGQYSKKYRYIWHDNFYRADSSTIGTNGDSAYAMNYTSSNIGIANHYAVLVQDNTIGTAIAETNVPDCIIEFQADSSTGLTTYRGAGIIFRYTDAQNYFYLTWRKTYLRLIKKENGSDTTIVGQDVPDYSAITKAGVKLEGNKITFVIDNIDRYVYYSNFNATATQHGIIIERDINCKIKYFGIKVPAEYNAILDPLDSQNIPFYYRIENAGKDYNFTFDTENVNGSLSSMRFENRKADAYKRSEIALLNSFRPMMDEQVYSWDMYLDDEYSVVEPTIGEIITQLHDTPKNGDESLTGTPCLALSLRNGEYRFRIVGSEDYMGSETGDMFDNRASLGSYLGDVGKWVNWKLHVKWAYNKFFEPLTELYKDGELVFTSTEPNTRNATMVPYFKTGMYNFDYVEQPDACVSEKRVMHIDNIKAWL